MKTLIILATILWASVAWGHDTWRDNCNACVVAEGGVSSCVAIFCEGKQVEASNEFIRQLAKSGRICEVLGHEMKNVAWEYHYNNPTDHQCNISNLISWECLRLAPNELTNWRKCTICNKEQKYISEWEDIK